jgi:hypothetical protein
MLRFAAHVDWKHMKLGLLNRLNEMAAATGHTLYIFSGYRSDKYSAKVGGFKGDPHTHGIAADVRVDSPGGKYIGTFYGVKTLAKYGLRSGNVPNFYHGKPDSEHVDLVGYGYTAQGTLSGTNAKDPYVDKAAAALPAPVGTQVPVPDQVIGTQPPPQTTVSPEMTQPVAGLLPGTVSGDQSPIGASQYWQKVVQQPSVSPDTQQYASMFNA